MCSLNPASHMKVDLVPGIRNQRVGEGGMDGSTKLKPALFGDRMT